MGPKAEVVQKVRTMYFSRKFRVHRRWDRVDTLINGKERTPIPPGTKAEGPRSKILIFSPLDQTQFRR